MSVNALKPSFNNREGYRSWIKTWKAVYGELTKRIRHRKAELRTEQRTNPDSAGTIHAELFLMRRDATKMMTLLKEAKLLLERIGKMQNELTQQGFPLDLGDCRNIDVHFNKISIQFPFMPKWVLKTKGKTYYVTHIDAKVAWSTRELESGPTLGMIRFKRANISIDQEGTALLTERVLEPA
jgi:hypothetical protein